MRRGVSHRDYQAEPIMDNVDTNILQMQSLNLDSGESRRHKFFVVVDRATTFLWSQEFDCMSSDNVVKLLTSFFSTFGLQLKLRSDSGPAFRQS